MSVQERIKLNVAREVLRDTRHNGFPVVRNTPHGQVGPLPTEQPLLTSDREVVACYAQNLSNIWSVSWRSSGWTVGPLQCFPSSAAGGTLMLSAGRYVRVGGAGANPSLPTLLCCFRKALLPSDRCLWGWWSETTSWCC